MSMQIRAFRKCNCNCTSTDNRLMSAAYLTGNQQPLHHTVHSYGDVDLHATSLGEFNGQQQLHCSSSHEPLSLPIMTCELQSESLQNNGPYLFAVIMSPRSVRPPPLGLDGLSLSPCPDSIQCPASQTTDDYVTGTVWNNRYTVSSLSRSLAVCQKVIKCRQNAPEYLVNVCE